MGKLVKYCAGCDESYAEKFSFCPICATELSTYQLNPLVEQPANAEAKIERANAEFEKRDFNPQVSKSEEPAIVPAAYDVYSPNATLRNGTTNGVVAGEIGSEAKYSEPEIVSASATQNFAAEEKTFDDTVSAFPSEETPAFETRESLGSKQEEPQVIPQTIDEARVASRETAVSQPPKYIMHNHSHGYNVTFVEEKGQGVRRMLLLGSFLLVSLATVGGVIYSLYTNNAYVAAMDGDLTSIVYVADDTPTEEPEPPKPETNDDAGGGGGGGREEQKEASKGRLPPQEKNPQTPPNVNIPIIDRPAIAVIQKTQGTIDRPRTTERTGLPYGISTDPSNGPGSGGGIGTGRGTGVGRGTGTGEGSGTGSGSGSGVGSGIGGGRGAGVDGGGEPPPAPKPKVPAGPPVGFNIISKPRANYTDAARVKQTSGVVRLKITFNANGTVGSISAVSGLPDGLTEQAIAAARQIKFTPANRGGVPVTVTKTIDYVFNMY